MTEKRFTETVSTGDVHDTFTGKDYRCEYRIDDEFLELVNNIAEENEQLKSMYSEQCIQLDFLKDENQHMRDLVNENRQLKSEINMLKVTIGRNEAYINRLTHTSRWR